MKKHYILALSAFIFIFIGAQAVYAGTGKVTTKFFESEEMALSAAQKISKEIVAGNNSAAKSMVNAHCQSTSSATYTVPMFSVMKTYVDTGNDWGRSYFASIEFKFKCNYRVNKN